MFPEKINILEKYGEERIKIFGLYISRDEVPLSNNDHELFANLIFVQPKTLNYFQWIVQCIKYSAKNEIFRFLDLKNSDIGMLTSSSNKAEITAPIIYPKSFTGLSN